MSRDLRLQVILSAVDKVTAPIKRIQQGAGGVATQLKATQDRLRQLQSQQRNLTGFREMQTALEGTRNRLQEAQLKVREFQQRMAQGEGGSKRFQQQFARAQTQVTQLTGRLQQQQQRLEGHRTALQQAGVSTHNLGASEARLSQQIAQANSQLATQRSRLDAVAQRQRQVQQLNQQHSKQMMHLGMMGGTGFGMQAVGRRGLTEASRLLAPGLGFAEVMSELQAVSRLQRDDEQFQMLQGLARQLGAATAFSANEVGSAQVFLARAGFSPDAIQAALGDILDLALANGVDLARTADIASNISGVFKLDPDIEGNMQRIADVLSATSARANVNLEMLGETMKYLGQAEGLDISLEQAAAMAGLLGNIGIQGSQAGTTLRAMANRLAAPMGQATQAMAALGLNATDSMGNLRDITDILADVAWAVEHLGTAERAEYLKKIFGTEAGSGMAHLVEEQGTGALLELIRDLDRAQGENAHMAAVRNDNLMGDLKGLRSAWEDIGITLSVVNDGPLRQTTQHLTGLVRTAGEWLQANQEQVQQWSRVIGLLLVGVTVLGTVTIALTTMLAPLLILRFMLMRVGLAALGLGPVFKVVGLGAGWLGGAVAGLSRILLALVLGPLRLLRGGMTGMLSAVSGLAKGLLGWLVGPLRTVIVATMINVKTMGVWQTALAALRAIVFGFGGALRLALLFPLKLAAAALMALFSPIGLLVAGLTIAAIAIIRHWEPIKAFFVGFGQGIMQGLQPLQAAWAPAIEAIGNALAPLQPAWEGLVSILGKAWDWFTQLVRPVQHTSETLQQASHWGEALGQGLGSIIALLIGLIPRFITLGSDIIGGLIQGIQQRWQDLRSTFGDLTESLTEWFKNPLGIRSPSRVFAGFGQDTLAGYQQGIEQSTPGALRQVMNLSERLKAAGASLVFAGMGTPAMAANMDTRPPLSAGAPSVTISSNDTYHFTIQAAPGMDTEAITRQIERMLDERERATLRRVRSQLHD